MSYKFACPKCGQHISAEPRVAGTAVSCPECRQSFVAPPQAGSATVAAAAITHASTPSGLLPIPLGGTGALLAPGPHRRRRRHALLVFLCCLIPIGALLVPPWQHLLESSGGARIERPARFSPLWDPPLVADAPANPNDRILWSVTVDPRRYLGTILASLLLSCALWYVGQPRGELSPSSF